MRAAASGLALSLLAALSGCRGGVSVNTTVDDGGPVAQPDAGPALGLRLDGLPADGGALVVGDTAPLRAFAQYAGSIERDVSGSAFFSSSAPSVAAIDPASHLLTAVAKGSALVTASLSADGGGLSASATVQVKNAGEDQTVRIEVAPSQATLAPGVGVQLHARATQGDGSQRDATLLATWTSSDPACQADDGAHKGFVTGVSAGSCTITATLGALSASAAVTVQPLTVSALAVSPASAVVTRGESAQLTATATLSDGTAHDVTRTATWTVDQGALATVAAGLVAGVAVGTVTVTAALGGQSAQASVRVDDVALTALSVTPPSFSLAQGLVQQCRALAVFADGTSADVTAQATWTSSDAAIVTVGSTPADAGLVRTATGKGKAKITAALRGATGVALVSVTDATLTQLELFPASLVLPLGANGRFRAAGTYSDHSVREVTLDVSWSVDDPGVATTDATGLVTALAKGATKVHASLQGISATAAVTVSDAALAALLVVPTTLTLPNGAQGRLGVSAIYTDNTVHDATEQATWTSATPGAATVSNAAGTRGQVTAVAEGTALVSASLGGLQSNSATITVTAAALSSVFLRPQRFVVVAGLTLPVRLFARYSDGTEFDQTGSATFSSSSPQSATVVGSGPQAGFVTGIAPGQATITGTLAGLSASAFVLVSDAQVTALRIAGPDTLKVGQTAQFRALATFTNVRGEIDVTLVTAWSSSDQSVANALPVAGVVTALKPGAATIGASFQSVSATRPVTVVQGEPVSIKVVDSAITLPATLSRQLLAIATYPDSSTADVTLAATWASDAARFAVVSDTLFTKGLVTGVAPGTAHVSAAIGAVSGSSTVTVNNAKAKTIIVTPTNPTTVPGTRNFQFYATGTFDDGQNYDLTRTVNWSSDNPGVCSISDSTATKGRADVVGIGGATITARFGTLSGSTFLTSR